MRKASGKSFEELLLENGLLNREKLQDFLSRSTKEKKTLEQLLLESGFPEDRIASIKAEYLGYEFIDPSIYPVPPPDLLITINPAYAKNYKLLPIQLEDEVITFAMVEPRNSMVLDEIVRFYRNSKFQIKEIKVVMTSFNLLIAAIQKFYALPKDEQGMGSILTQVAESLKPTVEEAHVSREDANENSAPIVLLANKVVEEAFHKRASDIHVEPAENYLRVRVRIDGELSEIMRVPKYAQDPLLARFKIMSDMRLDEKRVPQDGRIDFMKYNPQVQIDLRVSTVPTPHGEDIVIRILEKKSAILSLDRLGFNDHNMNLFKEAVSSPYGIVLHVGPTGSGKTTALYAALKSLDTPDRKIVTAEDPVEYSLGGQIIQSNIHVAAGYTFSKAIRAFMRHDPDIILVGEIRDLDTAKAAVEASLTGHMVFSTLHTNDAVGTITRLTEMGIESYLVGDSLVLVCAQRLIRRICPKCKESYVITDEEVELTKGDIQFGTVLFIGRGCDACDQSGYRGRVGIFEVLKMNKKLRALLIKGAHTDELRRVAIETGMKTLREDAIEKTLNGLTTLEELVGATLAEG
ncbi:MAG: type II/IV secretion system protein [Desulfobacca sp.]|nr:type II/IV secretion system protein [Desulfobacca sp.]